MKKILNLAEGTIPTLIENTRFHISIDGWPAAVSIFAICGTYVAVNVIKANHAEVLREQTELKRDCQPSQPDTTIDTSQELTSSNQEMELAAA